MEREKYFEATEFENVKELIYDAVQKYNQKTAFIIVMDALDGLPPVKVHCSLLAEEAIHAALWDYAEKNGIVIEGLEKPAADIEEKIAEEY